MHARLFIFFILISGGLTFAQYTAAQSADVVCAQRIENQGQDAARAGAACERDRLCLYNGVTRKCVPGVEPGMEAIDDACKEFTKSQEAIRVCVGVPDENACYAPHCENNNRNTECRYIGSYPGNLDSHRCRAKTSAQAEDSKAIRACAVSVPQAKPECVGAALFQNAGCVAAMTACANDYKNKNPGAPGAGGTRKSDCDAIAARNAACEVIADPADRADCQQQAESAFNACIQSCVDCTGGDGTVQPQRGKPEGYTGPIPDCAFTYEGCRDVNNLLELLIKVGQAIFGIIGSIAFLMFIYGGFTIILAQGSAEKFKKGYGIVFAAVIGLLISFAAYIIVDLVLEALNVSSNFRGIK